MILDLRQSTNFSYPAIFPSMNIGDIKKRLREVRASQRELAEFMGIDFRAVGRIVNGERVRVSQAEVEQIRNFFELRERPTYDVRPDDESRGTGVRLADTRAEIPLFGGLDTPQGWRLSLSARAQVGRVMAHPAQASAKKAIAVEVVDDSMSPRFEMSEIAYVYVGQHPNKGQDCLVEYPDLTARILQFMERTDKRLVFRQLNPSKQAIYQASDNLKIHAIVGRG